MLKVEKPSKEKATTEKEEANKEEPTAQEESKGKENPKGKDTPALSKKEQLKQEQEKNSQELFEIIDGIEKVDKKALETVEKELKGRKLSKKHRQYVNKWLRDTYAILQKVKKPSKESRGKKAKPVTMNQIRNGVKETIVKVQKYADQQIEQRKSVRRILNAKLTLQRLLRYQLTE